MNYEKATTIKKPMTIDEVNQKHLKTLKNLQKELERKNRDPSIRLGKNAKKRAARREKVLAEEVENSDDNDEELTEQIGVKPPRIPLSRMKRKPGHRDGRPDVPEFDDYDDVNDVIEFPELKIILVEPAPQPKMSILLDAAIQQLCSKQDIVITCTIESKEGIVKQEGDMPIQVICAMDGHGTDLVADIIRNFVYEDHFQKQDTPSSMQSSILATCKKMKDEDKTFKFIPSQMTYLDYLKKKVSDEKFEQSGATYSAAFIHRNEKTNVLNVVAEWVGDSPIFIFVNGELVFKADEHHSSNEKEVELMIQKGFIDGVQSGGGGFELISEDEIISKPGKYTISKVQLACTRSLGHNGLTCIEADRVTITAKMTDEVKVIVCSDGVGDMLYMNTDLEKLKTYSAEELVDLAEKRWKQVWKYNGKTTRFPANGYDDCCAAVWWQKKE